MAGREIGTCLLWALFLAVASQVLGLVAAMVREEGCEQELRDLWLVAAVVAAAATMTLVGGLAGLVKGWKGSAPTIRVLVTVHVVWAAFWVLVVLGVIWAAGPECRPM